MVQSQPITNSSQGPWPRKARFWAPFCRGRNGGEGRLPVQGYATRTRGTRGADQVVAGLPQRLYSKRELLHKVVQSIIPTTHCEQKQPVLCSKITRLPHRLLESKDQESRRTLKAFLCCCCCCLYVESQVNPYTLCVVSKFSTTMRSRGLTRRNILVHSPMFLLPLLGPVSRFCEG